MRCIKCGSKHIALQTKNEGYSYAKGIVGQAVFGQVGAVAGINGKKKEYYHCSECGWDDTALLPGVVEGL